MKVFLANTVLLIGVALVATAGCSDSPADEPAKFVADGSAQPIAEQTRAAGANADPAVVQAAYAEEPTVPPVLLTSQHEALCRVKVGDVLPSIELPKVGGGQAKLADLYGSNATVVVFWKSDRQMTHEELADLGPDVVKPFATRAVAVVGIAVEESASDARAVLRKAGAEFANLLDADGKAFAKVGSKRLPWTLVLDAAGKIVWFDIEYSHATRRELKQALLATVK